MNTIVHIGAGRCGEYEEFRATGAKRIVLIEPDPETARYLRESFNGDERTEIIDRAVTTMEGPVELKLFNARRYSSLREPTGLRELYPGLRKTGELYPDMWTPKQMCEELGINEEGKYWLAVDAPGEEWAILESLRDEGLLTRFERVSVYAADTVLYKGGRKAKEILSLLDELGWEPSEEDDESDPERPRYTLERDARKIENLELKRRIAELEAELQKQQEQFSALEQERDELLEKNKSLNERIEMIQDQLSVSLKLQKAREGDLKELQTKFEKITTEKRKQEDLLVEVTDRLSIASNYFHELTSDNFKQESSSLDELQNREETR